jgi:DNA-binding transcriptional ArsR family regulator
MGPPSEKWAGIRASTNWTGSSKPKLRQLPEPRSALDLIFDALGDPTRRRILDRLSAGPASGSALAEPLGITLTAVAQHLRVLEEAKLVSTEKVGRVRTCRLEPAGFEALANWTQQRRSIWEHRLDRMVVMFTERP